jgi:squalene synthase HpnC
VSTETAADTSFLTVQYRPAMSTADAFAWCKKLATSTYENFTVVSWFLPKELRADMYAVYAFCRTTDNLGDEAPGDRLAMLDEWEADLQRAFVVGAHACPEPGRRGSAPAHPAHIALAEVARRRNLPIDPFERLIEANRRDQRASRYETYGDLLEYCNYSAMPVGRMVLGVWGYTDEERGKLSDATCTALQLANFWQDVRRDYAKSRIYLPVEDIERFGVSEEQIAEGRADASFKRLLKFECDRASALFGEGEKLLPLVRRDLRLDLELFSAGGKQVLKAIERRGYDVLSKRPEIGNVAKMRLMAKALIGLQLNRLRA